MFGRKGDNLTLDLPVSYPEAALGANVEVPTLNGPVTLKVPAGTPSGKTFRVQGKGAPKKGGHGDLLVTVSVDVPGKLSREEKQLLQAAAGSPEGVPAEATGRGVMGGPTGSSDDRRGRTSERAVYMISVAAELAGVHPQTLRIYERKGLVRPKRTQGNTRRYSDARHRAAATDPGTDAGRRHQPGRREDDHGDARADGRAPPSRRGAADAARASSRHRDDRPPHRAARSCRRAPSSVCHGRESAR